jgi:hypothetical protein
MAAANNQITAPRVPLLDPQTGSITREWYLFFYNLYTLTGAGTGVTPVTAGGTGLSTIPANGQLLIGNGTGYTLRILTAGTGITVTNGVGAISLANSGVLSFSGGTTGLTPSSASSGNVVLGGALIATNGGTGYSSYTVGNLLYANTTTTFAKLSVGTTGQVLTVAAGVPTWSSAFNGTVGATTPSTGAFTTLSASSTVSGAGFSTYLASPPAIGGTAAAAGTFTTMTATADSAFTSTGAVQLSAGTTAQRPTGVAGKIRYNSSLTQFEGYSGSAWSSIGGNTGPAFNYYIGANQNATGSSQIITYDTKVFDTANCFNNTGSTATLNGLSAPAYSFTPNVAGYYQINCSLIANDSVSGTGYICALYKNTSLLTYGITAPSGAGTSFQAGSVS